MRAKRKSEKKRLPQNENKTSNKSRKDTLKCNPIDKESRRIQKEAAKQHGSRKNTITENETKTQKRGNEDKGKVETKQKGQKHREIYKLIIK